LYLFFSIFSDRLKPPFCIKSKNIVKNRVTFLVKIKIMIFLYLTLLGFGFGQDPLAGVDWNTKTEDFGPFWTEWSGIS